MAKPLTNAERDAQQAKRQEAAEKVSEKFMSQYAAAANENERQRAYDNFIEELNKMLSDN